VRADASHTGPSARRLAALFVLLVATALSGCGTTQLSTIPLHTAAKPETACDAALATGRLTNNRPNGLALQGANGETSLVLWPFGYRTQGVVGSMELIDDHGQFVAREGDMVEMTGGMGTEGFFVACAGTIKVVPPG
jgi:hypothetical protein